MTPAITSNKLRIYKTFHTACLGLTYLQARTATIQIIIAVATPCNAATILRLTPTRESIIEITYSNATATNVYIDILLSPQRLPDDLVVVVLLDDLLELELFELLAIFNPS